MRFRNPIIFFISIFYILVQWIKKSNDITRETFRTGKLLLVLDRLNKESIHSGARITHRSQIATTVLSTPVFIVHTLTVNSIHAKQKEWLPYRYLFTLVIDCSKQYVTVTITSSVLIHVLFLGDQSH